MNTDKILDFIVEYYIWFVIGGFIIIMAIIGFIADRKKLLPSKNKDEDVKKVRKTKKDEFDFDNDISNDEEQFNDNQSESEIKADENTSNLKDSWNIDMNTDVSSDIEVNDAHEDVTSDYNNYENVVTEENNISNSEDNENYSSTSSSENADYDDLDKTSESYSSNEVYENENVHSSEYEDNSYEEKVQEIKEDIDKIDDMFPNKSDDISEEERNIDYKNTGDNQDQTLQVNYSQLREMVEDIIAETQNENNQKNVDEDRVETDNQTVQDIPLPNLNHISVDAIKAQDEDEDDVWRF